MDLNIPHPQSPDEFLERVRQSVSTDDATKKQAMLVLQSYCAAYYVDYIKVLIWVSSQNSTEGILVCEKAIRLLIDAIVDRPKCWAELSDADKKYVKDNIEKPSFDSNLFQQCRVCITCIEFISQKLKEEKEQREQQLKEEKEQREQQLEAERKLFYAELDRRDKSGEIILERWKARVFRIKGTKGIGSGLQINKSQILTAAHLGFALNEEAECYNVDEKRIYKLEPTFISNHYDFALLECKDTTALQLPYVKPIKFECTHSSEFEISGADADSSDQFTVFPGRRYFLLGFPYEAEEKVAISSGFLEGMNSKNAESFNLVPGSRRGYSGGPIFDGVSHLPVGICSGGPSFSFSMDEPVIAWAYKFTAEQTFTRVLMAKTIKECLKSGTDTDPSCPLPPRLTSSLPPTTTT